MTTQLSPLPVQRFYDNNNFPLVGGQLYTYVAGTTTNLATYTDSTGVTANPNPVIMNARGEANVWLALGRSYKFVLKDASGNTIWTVDNIINGTGLFVANAKDFGATGNGTADDTLALQAAINYCVANKMQLYLPSGTYRHSGLTVTGGALTLVGAGADVTSMVCTNLSGTGIAVDAQQAFCCSCISFASSGTVTAGSAISLTSSAGGTANQHSIIRECTFTSQQDSIRTIRAYLFTIEDCTFNLYLNSGVWVQNDFNGDAGDSIITKCVFAGTAGSFSKGIFHVSSGGLRVTNNKFVMGAYGYLMQLAHLIQTSVLIFANNSVENLTVAGIQMQRIPGGAADMHFTSVVIANNEFLGTTTGIPINLNDVDPSWLLGVSITGNAIDTYHAGQPPYAILVNGANGFNISGNTLVGNGTPGGIGIGAAASFGAVGVNTTTGFTLPISNSSTTTSVAKKVLQGTTGTITCSNPFGGGYEASVSVTFPTNFFGSVPVVTATPNGGINGMAAGAFNATTAGVSIRGVASSSGANITCAWRAEADY